MLVCVYTLTRGYRFDGDVVEEYNRSAATHVVCKAGQDDSGIAARQESVSADWLWKCITRRKLLPD